MEISDNIIRETDTIDSSCKHSSICSDYKKHLEDLYNKDLSDQEKEVCNHPSDNVRKKSCILFNEYEGLEKGVYS